MTRRKRYNQVVNSILLLILIFLIGYIFLAPVDVIKNENWKLTTDKSTYYQNDTISVTSSYTKVREVVGLAQRFLDCDNGNGGYVRYPVSQAEANRKPGSNGTGIFIGIPDSIPTPTKCKVAISIKYSIYPLRDHTEYNESPLFTLLPESARPQDSAAPSQTTNVTNITTTPPTQKTVIVEPQNNQNNPQNTQTEPQKQCTIKLLSICVGGN